MQDMASRMVTNLHRQDTSESAEMHQYAIRELNLITTNQKDGEILNVQQNMIWVQAPCAVNSSACANDSPEEILAEMLPDTRKLEPK